VANDEFKEARPTPNNAKERSRSRSTFRRSAPNARKGPPPETLPLAECALFFDVDGTLIDIAARPAELLQLLRTLRRRCQDALALVSGRRIADLDRITAPERFTAAGLHGFERRTARGHCVRRAPPPAPKMGEVRRVLAQLASAHPQLLLEDKDYALAVHYRQAPHLRAVVERAIRSLPDLQGSGLKVQQGRMVAEIAPSDASKATALAEFMDEPPFKGRLPVYVGDDLTDESAFQWVNAAGGLSVDVSRRQSSCARTHLASVRAVRAWLHALTEAGAGGRA
jgi:trehalose 6-phosphate phosphatase